MAKDWNGLGVRLEQRLVQLRDFDLSTPRRVEAGRRRINSQHSTSTMNRIYQGKVTAVKIPDGKDDQGKPLDLSAVGYRSLVIGHSPQALDAVNF